MDPDCDPRGSTRSPSRGSTVSTPVGGVSAAGGAAAVKTPTPSRRGSRDSQAATPTPSRKQSIRWERTEKQNCEIFYSRLKSFFYISYQFFSWHPCKTLKIEKNLISKGNTRDYYPTRYFNCKRRSTSIRKCRQWTKICLLTQIQSVYVVCIITGRIRDTTQRDNQKKKQPEINAFLINFHLDVSIIL